MNRIALTRRDINDKELLRRPAAEADTERVISEPGVYEVDGAPAIIYGKLSERYDRMLWAVKTLGYSYEKRTSGGGSIGDRNRSQRARSQGLGESKIFGYRPRIPYQANYCSVCATAEKYPGQHAVLCEFGRLLSSIYEAAAPEVAERHSAQLKQISADWILPGTLFTSGIANRNNPLKYHYDKGNLVNVMSCMVVFRQFIDGGCLSIPALNARFLLEDHTYFMFDGQSWLHGVTPIRRMNNKAYRYSVVYYALRAMGKCGTLHEEIARARVQKREREKRRV